MARSSRTFEQEGTTEEAAQTDYRKIAERRVRLGLVLSEIGEKNKIEVREDELQRALAAQLRQFPGNEKQVLEYYRKDPDAISALRAPIFEEKGIDLQLLAGIDSIDAERKVVITDAMEEAMTKDLLAHQMADTDE